MIRVRIQIDLYDEEFSTEIQPRLITNGTDLAGKADAELDRMVSDAKAWLDARRTKPKAQ